jgi:hypothetical protein
MTQPAGQPAGNTTTTATTTTTTAATDVCTMFGVLTSWRGQACLLQTALRDTCMCGTMMPANSCSTGATAVCIFVL